MLRFTDRLMTFLAYSALVSIVFAICKDFGSLGQFFLPFLQIIIAAVVYRLFTPLLNVERFRHYQPCLVFLKVLCLIAFYGAGNYFIVREAGVAFLGLPRAETLPVGWLFWTWTIGTPVLYIYWGLRKKDPLFLWVGLVLVAAMILTIRYYYHVLPAEVAMVIGGAVLVGASYALMRYLRTPRYGFCNVAATGSQPMDNIHIETLVIAETFAPAPPIGNDFHFGGGSGSGGGAGGEYSPAPIKKTSACRADVVTEKEQTRLLFTPTNIDLPLHRLHHHFGSAAIEFAAYPVFQDQLVHP